MTTEDTIDTFMYLIKNMTTTLTARYEKSLKLRQRLLEGTYGDLLILYMYSNELSIMLEFLNYQNDAVEGFSYSLAYNFDKVIKHCKKVCEEVDNYLKERNFKPLENEIL